MSWASRSQWVVLSPLLYCPQGILTLFLLELILTHEHRSHQLPHRWLNGDVELSSLGAGEGERRWRESEASISALASRFVQGLEAAEE